MAKKKNIGTLPPAFLDVPSTPGKAKSEAGIDTQGYDPAWGAPPEPPGHPISFGKTLDALLGGGKSVTRRKWEDFYAQQFINRFKRGWKVQAFDKDRRYGGQLVGWLKLTQKPYRERLGDMPDSDVAAEGFPELSKTEFLDRFFQGDASKVVWVIRFEFEPLKLEPELSPVSESADVEPELESVSPAAEEPTSVAVEVVEAETPVIDDELSYEEERDRLHLERKVERAFYEAGRALRELRDRRLYRSTHKTFESYCRDRFGHSRQKSNFWIAAAGVYENLLTHAEELEELEKMTTNGCQNVSTGEMTTNGCQNVSTGDLTTNSAQILPTNERQIRPLTKLEPELQPLAWDAAIESAGGKVPSGRVVKDVVDRIVQDSLPEATRAHHLSLVEGGLVEIRCPGNETIHTRYGRIAKVREKTVEVWLRDTEAMLMVKHSLKHQQVEAVPLEREPSCLAVARRIEALRGRSLDPFELEMLALLERAVVLTPVELGYLEAIEGRSRCAIEGRVL
ncbi:MAG: hypothetical protein WBC69_21755 [Geitlerinemataceae cyanobacterium]